MPHATRRGVGASIMVALLASACGSRVPTQPTTQPALVVSNPSNPAPAAPSSRLNWVADGTTQSVTGSDSCAVEVAFESPNTKWLIVIGTDSVELLENGDAVDFSDYHATLTGQAFSAADEEYDLNAPARGTCDFRGGTIAGTFSADFTTFDATETWIYGPPDNRSTVVWHWTGRKIQ